MAPTEREGHSDRELVLKGHHHRHHHSFSETGRPHIPMYVIIILPVVGVDIDPHNIGGIAPTPKERLHLYRSIRAPVAPQQEQMFQHRYRPLLLLW